MDFVSTVLSLSQKHDKGAHSGRAFCQGKGGGGSGRSARVRRKRGTRYEHGWKQGGENGVVGRGGEGKAKTTGGMGRTRGGEKGQALEETKGVFSSRRRIQMERSGLFSSRSPTNLPTRLPLCPRSPRINVARHAARNRMADPHEYIRSGRLWNGVRARMCNWLAARACAAPWN